MLEGDYSLFDEIPSLSSSYDSRVSIGQWDNSSEEITFFGKREDCCMCFIDMVNSTEIASHLTQQQIAKYYSLFLNSIAIMAKNFGATIIKNAGDCLIYYFPDTVKSVNNDGNAHNNNHDNDDGNKKLLAFKDVIECGMTIIAAHSIINAKLYEEKLPSLNYRISAEYGTVEFAKSLSSKNQDLFGHAMNLCAKMNPYAPINGMVIGNRLYQVVKSFHDYNFERIDKFPENTLKNADAVYSVTSKQKKTILNPFSRTSELKPLQKLYCDSINKSNIIKNKRFGTPLSSTSLAKKIMIVDDEEDILFTFKTILSNEGYRVDDFINSKEALRQFEKDESYDIVITDIKMPNLNGLELYNKIKSKRKDAKVLFISALEGAEMLLSVLPDLTEKNIIKKPVEKDKLVESTKLLLDEGRI
ncbi:MAG: response regulator [Thermoproteota archaeon]|nr:response regulator [Thermoproteota archaeon]